MPTPLHALIVEDSEDDVALLLRQLRAGGYEALYERVQTAGAMRAALERRSWDVIFCDYNMPGFSGPAALEVHKASGRDAPFILVSGSVGEAAAVEVMKAGADDYIVKDDFTRLIPALQRELGRAEASRRQVANLLESISDGFVAFDAQMNYTYVNTRGGELLGRKPGDLIGKNYWVEYPEAKGTPFAEAYARALETQTPIQFENYYAPWDRWFENRIYPSQDGLAVFFTEITGRKRMEESLRLSEDRFRAIATKTPDHILMQDRDLRYQFVINPQLGLTEADMIGRTDAEILPGEDGERLTAIKKNVIATGEPFHLELSLKNLKGGTEYFDGSYIPNFDSSGAVDGLFGYFRNITERKRAEEQLRESEQRYSLLFDKSAVPALVFKMPEVVIVDANEALEKLAGYTRQEMRGKTTLELGLTRPEERGQAIDRYKQQGALHEREIHIFTRTGEERIIVGNVSPLELSGQRYAISTMQDVTERRRAEEALRSAEIKYRSLVEQIPAIVYASQVGGLASDFYVSPQAKTILGFDADEWQAVPDFWLAHLHPDDRERVMETLNECERTRTPFHAEYRMYGSGGQVVWFRDEAVAIEREGEAPFWQGIMLDITARKRAEEALRLSEERFSKGFRSSPEGLVISRMVDGTILEVNESFLRILGHAREEVIGHSSLELNMFADPRDRQRAVRRLREKGAVRDFELEIRRKNGEIRWATLSGEVIEIAGELCLLTIISDITERKRAEEALRQSEERFSKAFYNSPLPMSISTMGEGRFVDVNEGYLRLVGYRREDLIGRTSLEVGLWDDPAQRGRVMERLRKEKRVRDEEMQIVTASGERRLAVAAYDVIELDGVACVVGLFDDITERKRAEEALRESQRRLSTLISNLPGAVYRSRNDKNWTTEFVSEGVFPLTGYPHSDFMEHRREFGELIHPDEGGRVWNDIQSALHERRPFELTYRIVTASGAEKWVWERGSGVYDADGMLLALEGFVTDITERKRAEEALRRSESMYRSIARNIPHGAVALFDKDLRFIVADGSAIGVAGPPRELVEGRTIWEALPQEVCQMIEPLYRDALAGKETVVEVPFGDYLFESHYVPVRDEEGKIFAGMVMSHDITERKRAEDEIRKLNAQLEQRVREMMVLNNLGSAVSASLSLDDVIPAVLREIAGSAAPDLALLYLQQNGKLILRGANPVDLAQRQRETQLRVGDCLCGLASSTEKAIFSGNVQADQRCTLDACKRAGLRSFAALPLVVGGKVLGVLGLAWAAEHEFGEQARFLETLAGEIAIGLQNAMLFEQVRRNAAELEERVAQRTAQLAAANKDLETFSYSVSHDLRAPLRAVNGFAEIVARRHRAALNEEGRHYVDNIVQASERMGRLIDDLLKYSRLGRQAVRREPIRLGSALAPLVSELEARLQEIGGTLQVEDRLPTVLGDKTLINRIFSNLFENAMTYRKAGEPLKITVSAQSDEKTAAIRIGDNGIGIPAEYHEKIFNIFQRLHSEDEYPGAGIGLATVKKSVELLGGDVWVESKVGEGSVFVVRLPSGEVVG